MLRAGLVSLWLPGLMAQAMYTDCRAATNSLSEFSLPLLDGSANTSLAEYIWRLKDQGRGFEIKWRTLATLPTYNPTTNSCRLCLVEKYTIMHQLELASINQHDEFYTACRHKEAKLLDKT